MADTVEKDIFQGLMLRMQAMTLPTGVERVLPGVNYAPTASSKFVSFETHFNRSIETDLSLVMDPIRQGFIRGNVMWPKGSAQVDAIEVAGIVRAQFKRGTSFYQDGTQIRFDQDPELGPLIIGTTHTSLSVTARWTVYPTVPA